MTTQCSSTANAERLSQVAFEREILVYQEILVITVLVDDEGWGGSGVCETAIVQKEIAERYLK